MALMLPTTGAVLGHERYATVDEDLFDDEDGLRLQRKTNDGWCHFATLAIVNPLEANKSVVCDMIDAVWRCGDLEALKDFWTEHAVNHADPSGRVGHAALREYHEGFVEWMAGLSDVRIEISQQICEGDLVATHLSTHSRHTGTVAGISASGRLVTLRSMRTDRVVGGKIDEHWSVADVAGFVDQLQPVVPTQQRAG